VEAKSGGVEVEGRRSEGRRAAERRVKTGGRVRAALIRWRADASEEEGSSRVARVECKTTLPAITEALQKLKLWLWYMLRHFIRVGVA
jgi:hypothetical protein